MLNMGTKARQFVNVVTEKCSRGSYNVFSDEGRGGLYSLRRIKASELFYGSTEEAVLQESMAVAAPYPMETTRSRLPPPLIRFNQSRPVDDRMNFWPFYGATSQSSNIVCIDAEGEAILYNTRAGTVETLPRLRARMAMGTDPGPVVVSITHPDAHDPARPDALYVMDRRSGGFEALIYGDASCYHDRTGCRADKFIWQWRQLPMPPFTRDRAHGSIGPYTLLPEPDGRGGTICVSSLSNGVGTYCFDAGSERWINAGSWRLPFYRRGQVVPELEGLCFGVSNYYPNDLVAVDLSSISTNGAHPPKVRRQWPVIGMPPAGWTPADVSMVYMGEGKFLVAKIFRRLHYQDARCFVDHETVVNAVEVVRENGGASKSKPELRMIKHKRVRYRLLNHRIQVL